MQPQAIALCRVSSSEQRTEGHSLERQEENVIRGAEELEAELIRTWSLDTSSKSGRNINRKDLKEIIAFVKANKRVKYLLVDEVDRFMRSIKEFYYFEGKLEFEYGVKTIYVSQPQYNDDTAMSKIQKTFDIMGSELENEKRRDKCFGGLKSRVKLGYYPFNPHQGYERTTTPGLHQPIAKWQPLLQRAFDNFASGRLNKYQSLEQLTTEGYRTSNGLPLRIDKFELMLKDDYYAGFITMGKWGEEYEKIRGAHTGIITLAQHEAIIDRLANRRIFMRRVHNPNFKLANILYCECGARFTGAKSSNGKGKYYERYKCRNCGKQYHRSEIHSAISETLKVLKLNPKAVNQLMPVFERIWREEQAQGVNHASSLNKNLQLLQNKKNQLVLSLGEHPTLKDDIATAIQTVKKEIHDVERQIAQSQEIENDLPAFIKFALNYIDNMSSNWWNLDFEDCQKCKQLAFPEEIIYTFQKTVCTPKISPILILNGMKKEPLNGSISYMVELIRKNLHQIVEESQRWRSIIGQEYQRTIAETVNQDFG